MVDSTHAVAVSHQLGLSRRKAPSVGREQSLHGKPNDKKSWRIVRKTLADLPRRAEVSHRAHQRYLHALADVSGTVPLCEWAEAVCKPVTQEGRKHAPSIRGRRKTPCSWRQSAGENLPSMDFETETCALSCSAPRLRKINNAAAPLRSPAESVCSGRMDRAFAVLWHLPRSIPRSKFRPLASDHGKNLKAEMLLWRVFSCRAQSRQPWVPALLPDPIRQMSSIFHLHSLPLETTFTHCP